MSGDGTVRLLQNGWVLLDVGVVTKDGCFLAASLLPVPPQVSEGAMERMILGERALTKANPIAPSNKNVCFIFILDFVL